MALFTDPLQIFALFSGVGATAAGLGFGYSQLKMGASKAKDDLIATLKETAAAEKVTSERLRNEKATLIDSHQKQINELNEKLGNLQGLYKASEESKKEYLAILQGRNPEQEQFMKLVVNQIELGQKQAPQVQQYMQQTTDILLEISNFMKQLNEKAAATSEFQANVADATEHETGKVLRKDV